MEHLVKQRNAIAIIPARGGSKRLPKKNILEFSGKPMIAWTIKAAIESSRFDRVLVSTDDAEISEISRSWGAEVPFLRERAADDYSPVSLATIAALHQAMEYWQERYLNVVQLMPNCPLRGAADIRDAMSAFDQTSADFQISCFRFGWMNPWWAVTLDQEGNPQSKFPEAQTARSQDLPPLYCPTGAIWIAKAAALANSQTFYGPNHRFRPMPWTSAVDIDDFEDLEFARAVFSMQAASPPQSSPL